VWAEIGVTETDAMASRLKRTPSHQSKKRKLFVSGKMSEKMEANRKKKASKRE
jgi:hypothetical protein